MANQYETIILLLLSTLGLLAAPTSPKPNTAPVSGDSARIAEAMATRYRVFDSQVCDVGPMAKHAIETGRIGGDWFLVDGKILQVIPNVGLLVDDIGPSEFPNPLFITNFPHLDAVIDGQRIKVLTKKSGRMTYKTAAGTTKTVAKFDCGKIATNEQFDEWRKSRAAEEAKANKAAEKLRKQEAPTKPKMRIEVNK